RRSADRARLSGRARAGLEVPQVRPPAVRDLRRREADEEDRGGRARLRPQLEPALLERPVSLAQVARRAGGDDVLPDGVAAARTRHDVVECQAPAGRPAVDAAPAVTGEERAPGDLPLHGPRHAHVGHEPDHVGTWKGGARRVKRLVELLYHLRLSFEHEDVSTSDRCHVQRLVARVEDENVLHLAGNVASEPGCYLAMARSTASCSSGESATDDRPWSSSLT